MKTKEEILQLIDDNEKGEWKPSVEITFVRHGNDDFTARFYDGFMIHCFGKIDEHIYLSESHGPVKDAVHILKYCSYLGIDTSEIKNLTPRTEIVEKEDVVGRAKLAVYQDIFRGASRITIDQK